MALSPHYTMLKDLDVQTKALCHKLHCGGLESAERITIAQQILMIQEDRKVVVEEIRSIRHISPS